MLSNIMAGSAILLEPELYIFLFFGVWAGVFIGVLPGLSSTMGVALLIPVTFGMEPVMGLAMLGAIYVSSAYAGAISAILLNIPGTSASIATLLDGPALTRKGEATRAVAVATFVSSIGGILSTFALLFLAPPLAMFSLHFGASEYFLLALFGITIIASLSEESIEKGLIAGCFGLLLAVVGMHPLTGYFRFCFGEPYLYEGIPVIVAMIGLYSIPEVINLITDKKHRGNTENMKYEGNNPFSHFKDLIKHKWLILKSSIIGIIIGIIPGAGSSIGGFVSYDFAKKSSKHPERFGKGSIEGVIASETANNAVTGGSLVPLLTLGIPGNAVTAVFLGGLMIHGLRPGIALFEKNPIIVYGFIISLFLSNLLFIPVGLITAKYGIKIIKAPVSLLAPLIMALAVIGSYSIRSSVFDVWMMVGLGFIGFIMHKCSIPRAPMVLGLVLGSMAEAELARAMALVYGSVPALLLRFLSRPISLILVCLIIFSIGQAVYRQILKSKK